MDKHILDYTIQILEEHFDTLDFHRKEQRDDCVFIIKEIGRDFSKELNRYRETEEKTSSVEFALEILKRVRGSSNHVNENEGSSSL
ncbi:hypothetical protein BKP35_16840 [Anaerobacillus arseniciselenatis]|uniref:Uncharacterized protein n=1 Tax=Anaerobacillus arseniciselenatis TaxID=85682 RepID=A0A1S2LC68_9BACI|nr:hypothetical protein [Anaerobacillus arseniciselenatis]OIJ09337.1 hypothetical protein BKP35_16840 [Anaerobacillus arseniciselenatis]